MQDNVKWYVRNWFIVLMLVILPIIGLILMFAFKKFNKYTRIIISFTTIIWMIILIIFAFIYIKYYSYDYQFDYDRNLVITCGQELEANQNYSMRHEGNNVISGDSTIVKLKDLNEDNSGESIDEYEVFTCKEDYYLEIYNDDGVIYFYDED